MHLSRMTGERSTDFMFGELIMYPLLFVFLALFFFLFFSLIDTLNESRNKTMR
jgi:predicted membrane protein